MIDAVINFNTVTLIILVNFLYNVETWAELQRLLKLNFLMQKSFNAEASYQRMIDNTMHVVELSIQRCHHIINIQHRIIDTATVGCYRVKSLNDS